MNSVPDVSVESICLTGAVVMNSKIRLYPSDKEMSGFDNAFFIDRECPSSPSGDRMTVARNLYNPGRQAA
jgi:hypothetical protein